MKEPVGLPDFIDAVISMEDSDFCKMIAGKALETKVVKQGQGVTFRNASVNQNSWRGRAQAKKRNGTCYTYNEKCSKAYLC
ncbi:unnamed protein product [Brassica oleracea]|uniref:(rape) hypothetical protein n=1 Tax=Brassica napus TaxID=3708 RepID=A0A816Q1X4_BRANA|nr:unnamed protein product [Brassica napus]